MQTLEGHGDASRALARIADVSAGVAASLPLFELSAVPAQAAAASEIVRLGDITDSRLVAYVMRERAIPIDLARLYLRELEYRVGERTYTALSFKNRAGGYELRNAVFKGTLGQKDLSAFEQPGRTDLGSVVTR